MSFQTKKAETLLGVLVLFLFMCLCAWTGVRQTVLEKRFAVMQADFDSVEGLTKGTPVKVNGVIVGSVLKIMLDEENNMSVRVVFKINKRVRIPRDSRATIASSSFLGPNVLNIELGNEDKVMEAGSVIYNTTPPMNLGKLIQQFLFQRPEEKKDKEPSGSSL